MIYPFLLYASLLPHSKAHAGDLKVRGPEAVFESQLGSVRASRSDLDVRPSRWETRSTIPTIERFLADPLAIPAETDRWAAELRSAASSAELIKFAADRLEIPLAAPEPFPSDRELRREREVPARLKLVIRDLLKTIARAQLGVDRAVGSLPVSDRRTALAVLGDALRHSETGRLDPAVFDSMAKFDRRPMLQAAYEIASAVDRALPALAAAADDMKNYPRKRWNTDNGDVLISGADDDVFTEDDLKDAALLIHMGGNSRYSGPVAAAQAGQIRVAVDLGRNIVIDSPAESFGAGSGVFGIGLLYLAADGGTKTIHTRDFSAGAGLFGVGGIFVRGDSVEITADHFAQGAGAYGAGILQMSAKASAYTLKFAGQGFGYTRGAGLFVHKGDGAKIDGGLFYPDSREALAAISLAQGVGYGPRAFAAGGVGLALIDGNSARLSSSYFAQGSGYWHGLGGMFVFGDDNRLQARRYDQGAGIHTAVGVLRIEGDKNHTINWGVGPAFGWDLGIGVMTLTGSDSILQADWSAGHGDYDGHAFALIRGNRNQFSLPDFGSGGLTHGSPSYGIAVIAGEQNKFRWNHPPETFRTPFNFRTAPWGIVHGEGSLLMDPVVNASKIDWPQFDRENAMRREFGVLESRIQRAAAKPAAERIADYLSIASSFGLASTAQGQPAHALLTLADAERPYLASLLSSDQFDEMIWLRTFLSAYGNRAKPELMRLFESEHGLRKSLAAGLFSTLPVADAFPVIEAASSDSDWRVRRKAAAMLGYLLDQQSCEISGRRTLMRSFLSRIPKIFRRAWPELLNQQYISDVYGLLSLDPEFAPDARIRLMDKTKNIYEPIGPDAIAEFERILKDNKRIYRAAFERELRSADTLEGPARALLKKLVSDPDVEVRQAALLSLGQIGSPRDAEVVAPFLSDDSAELRETASAALGKMGDAARPALEKALRSQDARTRAAAVLGAAQSSSRRILNLIEEGLADSDGEVRSIAAAALCRIQAPYLSERKRFIRRLEEMEKNDPSASARASAAYARVLIPK